jgi:hypothetical protein
VVFHCDSTKQLNSDDSDLESAHDVSEYDYDTKAKDGATVQKLTVVAHMSLQILLKCSVYFHGVLLLLPTVFRGEKYRTWHTNIAHKRLL